MQEKQSSLSDSADYSESNISPTELQENSRYKDRIDDGVFKGLFLPKREKFEPGEPPDGGWVAWETVTGNVYVQYVLMGCC